MTLNLDSLKNHLHIFANESNLTIKEIGELADNSSSLSDFKIELDKLCEKNISKTASELLAEFGTRFANTNIPAKPTPTDNSPLQNELVEVKCKLEELSERDKT